jgi:amidophosphoribosyltransferase
MLRDFGATEVYFAVACPPVQSPCFYGVDIPTRAELIASNKTMDEIKQYLEVDLLLYQEIEDLAEAVMRKGDHHIDRPCMACFDKHYITSEMNNEKIQELEMMRINDRNSY